MRIRNTHAHAHVHVHVHTHAYRRRRRRRKWRRMAKGGNADEGGEERKRDGEEWRKGNRGKR